MPRRRFTEEQIAYALKRHEAGTSATEVCREVGVSEASFYKWKAKHAGMGLTELHKLKAMEECRWTGIRRSANGASSSAGSCCLGGTAGETRTGNPYRVPKETRTGFRRDTLR